MTITYTADVFCDRCGVWTHGATAYKPNIARAARRMAKSEGWSFQSNSQYVDLCPSCLKAEQQASAAATSGAGS